MGTCPDRSPGRPRASRASSPVKVMTFYSASPPTELSRIVSVPSENVSSVFIPDILYTRSIHRDLCNRPANSSLDARQATRQLQQPVLFRPPASSRPTPECQLSNMGYWRTHYSDVWVISGDSYQLTVRGKCRMPDGRPNR